MKFEHDRDKALRLVLLMANLQDKGVNPLLFADKLHRATKPGILLLGGGSIFQM